MGNSRSKDGEDNKDTVIVNGQSNVSISDQIKNQYEFFSILGIVILIFLLFFLNLLYHRSRRKRSVHFSKEVYDL